MTIDFTETAFDGDRLPMLKEWLRHSQLQLHNSRHITNFCEPAVTNRW